jgi:hypothetical protein
VALWFDVNAPQPEGSNETDVRKLTQKVAYFITPRPADAKKSKMIPPAVRFVWGSFQFDGMMDSMEESLEFFSSEGVPQRASVTLALSQQRITEFAFADAATPPPGSGLDNAAAGTRRWPGGAGASCSPWQPLPASDWQSIAAANGIRIPVCCSPGS